MKKLVVAAALLCACGMYAQNAYTVIANPAQDASTAARISWHTDANAINLDCYYTKRSDKNWKKARKAVANRQTIAAYDSILSKTPDNKDFVEYPAFLRNTAELSGLSADTEYMYRFGTNPDAEVRYFKTAPRKGEWSAAVISDFHSYAPMPQRTRYAMGMLDTLQSVNGRPFDMILDAGDLCAWGGSYSFWRQLYDQPQFRNYMWAGVNGNHDNMDSTGKRLSHDYFRYANNNPLNGYGNQLGVCYWFRYGQVLFIMLNSEAMHRQPGLEEAQQWVRSVIAHNPAKYVVVMEHYEWFFGTNGGTSQYARWHKLFDECGVDLAIAGNNHPYVRTFPLRNDSIAAPTQGTVYMQTPSCDNGRGRAIKDWTDNRNKIARIWTEGPKTVGGVLLNVDDHRMRLTLHDRLGQPLDTVIIPAKRP